MGQRSKLIVPIQFIYLAFLFPERVGKIKLKLFFLYSAIVIIHCRN